MKETPEIVRLKDYTAPPYLIPKIKLHFDLKEEESFVTAHMTVTRNEKSCLSEKELFLDGVKLDLIEIKKNGLDLNSEDYQLDSRGILLKNCPDRFELETKVRLKPQDNKAFSGLYKTQKVFCTQMEAQGFRRTTFFMDRPDVLSQYETTLVADKDKYPILLSNGNLIHTETLEGGRHKAHWKDPFPKPCYLFALVAGDLDWFEDSYRTQSGRNVILKIFVNKGRREQTHYAMKSLKSAMKWDEQTFNLEYDLDIYNIVAVDDFNMGAMENKSLNIFNSKFVLASSQTATDEEFMNIQRVIGHEYFHNWSGNRVTCRDWFQLSLKEGLTVFRDQEFSSDMNSRAVKRIEDVMKLRSLQFPEDSGPMAHPVRPSSYIAIDNFYTSTVYNKGAEVIRMIKTLLGERLFKKGVARYFELFDGQAVTTDHWVEAMEQVSGRDLGQFRLWYDQAGTPQVFVQTQYHRERKIFEIRLSQKTKNPLTGKDQNPFHIPLKAGLISKKGQALAFVVEESPPENGKKEDFCVDSTHRERSTEALLELAQAEQVFYLNGVTEEPVLSINRQFSAPVHLRDELGEEELILLMKKDEDSFNRWESAQKIYHKQLIGNYFKLLKGEPAHFLPLVSEVLSDMILDKDKNPALLAKTLCLPQVQYLGQSLSGIDPQVLNKSYDHFYKTVSSQLHEILLKEYEKLQTKKLGDSFQDMALRAYKNRLLHLLYRHDESQGASLFYRHFREAENMTDSLSGLHRLGVQGGEFYDRAMDEFFEKWREDSLVVNKWLSVIALSDSKDCFKKIKEKAKSSSFNKTNPNNLFALFYCFAHFNWFQFHSKTGETYQWFADQVLDVDRRNPQVSARLGSCLNNWRIFQKDYQKHIKESLERILNSSPTNNLFEIINKALKNT